MARRSRRSDPKNKVIDLPRRDAFAITSPAPVRLSAFTSSPRSGRLYQVEDRRTFRPERSRPVRTLRGDNARIEMRPPSKRPFLFSLPEVHAFKVPQAVALCVRRKQRREVIMAKGKGGAKHRRPRRNATSRISCKR